MSQAMHGSGQKIISTLFRALKFIMWGAQCIQFNKCSHFDVSPFTSHCFETYDDFSTPCFDGRHHMIMGGSFISSFV